MKSQNYILSFLLLVLTLTCKNSQQAPKNENHSLSTISIMKKAHEKAGGTFWQKPKSLTLKGYGVFYYDGKVVKHEKHNMWREFEKTKEAAHVANGKVRIESYKEGKPVFIVTYDGNNTYNLNGKQEKTAADKRWSSNFGYGVIRHALDDGYVLEKVANDTIKSNIAYTIKVIDPDKGETFFGIDTKDFRILKVAFQTPRGWHHREYSNFFSKDAYSWLQAGHVALYYDGKLSNEVYWQDFEVNEVLADSLFIIK